MPDSTHDEGRPGERAALSVTGGNNQTVQRRRWARALINRASGPVPSYGSPDWLNLPESSPEKVAAVVVAAEAWALDGDDIEGRLLRELEDRRAAEEGLRRQQFVAEVVPMVRATIKRPARYAGQQVRPLEAIGADYLRGVS